MPKLKKRADGRYQKKITDPRTGKAIFFYGKTEREINTKILEYTTAAVKGRSFSTVSDEWWEIAEPKLADQSVRGYDNPRKKSKTVFGNIPIKKITSRDIQQYLNKLAMQGFAQKTIAQHRLVLNRIFIHAVLQGDIEFNPCAAVETPRNLPKTPRGAATTSDEQTVKETAHIWLFPYIALMTGMRKGEILALQWKDIDFDTDTIHVTKSVSHNGDRPSIKQPKTEAGNRIVPLLAPLKEKLLEASNHKPTDYIISDNGKDPLTNSRYCTLMSHYQKETGVTCTAHQLRHSFATIAFEAELEPKTVQEILGHKQLSTTMDIYTSFREKALKSAAEKLNNIM